MIIGGVFNILPETESIKMSEEAGYTDLIKKLGITTTRNQYAWDRHPNNKQYYSDYAFISPAVETFFGELEYLEVRLRALM